MVGISLSKQSPTGLQNSQVNPGVKKLVNMALRVESSRVTILHIAYYTSHCSYESLEKCVKIQKKYVSTNEVV